MKNKPQLSSVLYRSISDHKLVLARVNMDEISNIDDFIKDIPVWYKYNDLSMDVVFRVEYDISSECFILNDQIEIIIYLNDGDNVVHRKPLAIFKINRDKFDFDDGDIIHYYLDTTNKGYQYHKHLNIQFNRILSFIYDTPRRYRYKEDDKLYSKGFEVMDNGEKISVMIELSDVIGFMSCHSVIGFISRENVQLMYELFDAQPKNDDYDPDDSYINGEIRFNFNKETNELEEVLLFPVYENKYDPEDDDDGLRNGDFIRIDNMFSDPMIKRIWSFYEKNTNAAKEKDSESRLWEVQIETIFINIIKREFELIPADEFIDQ